MILLSLLFITDFDLGKKLYKKAEYILAIEAFKESLNKGEDSLKVLPYMGECYSRINKIDESIEIFELYMRKGGRDSKVIKEYVDICIKSNRSLRCVNFINENNIYIEEKLKLRLAESLCSTNPEAAFDILEDMEECKAGLIKAKAVSSMGKYGIAISMLNRLKSRCKDENIIKELIFNYIKTGDTLSVLNLCEEKKRIRDIEPHMAYLFGKFFYTLGDLERAEDYFKRAMEEDSLKEKSLINILKIKRIEGQYKECQSLLEQYKERNLEFYKIANIVSIILEGKGDLDIIEPSELLTEQELEAVIELSMERRRYDKSLEFIERLPEPYRFYKVGELYEKELDFDKAAEMYKKYIKEQIVDGYIKEAEERLFYIENFVPEDTSISQLFILKGNMERGLYAFNKLKNYRIAAAFFSTIDTPYALFLKGFSYELLYYRSKKEDYLERAISSYRDLILSSSYEDTLRKYAMFRFLRLSLKENLIETDSLILEFHKIYGDDPMDDTLLYLGALNYNFLRCESILSLKFPQSPLSHILLYRKLKNRIKGADSSIAETLKVLINSPVDSISYLSRFLMFDYMVSTGDSLGIDSLIKVIIKDVKREKDIYRIAHFILFNGTDQQILTMLSHTSNTLYKLYDLYIKKNWASLFIGVMYGVKKEYEGRVKNDIFRFLKGVALLKVKNRDDLLLSYYEDGGILKEKAFNILLEFYQDRNMYAKLKRILEKENETEDYLYMYIKYLYLSGDIKRGDEVLRKLQDSTVISDLTVYKFGYYVESNSIKKAMNLYKNLEKEKINNVDFLYYAGLLFFKTRKYKRGIEYFQSFIKKNGESKRVYSIYFKLGTMYYFLKDYDNSIDYYLKASLDKSLRKDALQNIYVVYKEKGEVIKGIDYLIKLSELSENREEKAEYEFRIGYAYFQLGKFPEALTSFKLAEELTEKNEKKAEYTYWTGEALLAMGNFKKAAYEFLKVVELYGDVFMWRITAEAKTAMCYELMEEYEKAYVIYKKIIKERKNDEWAQLARQRIRILKKEGKVMEMD